MTIHRSECRDRPRGGLWSRARALAVAALCAAAWCLDASGAWAQAVGIPTTGRLKVIGLRIEFVPDAPPRDANNNPVGPQHPSTRFRPQHNLDYFRNALDQARLYFLEVSNGKLELAPTVANAPVRETTWDQDEAYYGDDAAGEPRASALIQRAITLSESAINFANYDLVIVFHAGLGQESDFTDANADLILSRGSRMQVVGSGKTFAGAVLQSAGELTPAGGGTLSIVGRLCFGIMSVLGQGAMRTGAGLGQPNDDAYVGYWDLMDRGWMLGPALTSGRTDWSSPGHPNPYEKARMGWLTISNVTNNLPGAQIGQVEYGGPVYRMWGEGKVGPEYFLVENRQRTGYDSYLPQSGLVVWKINEAIPGQVDGQQLRISVLQADGRQDIENQANPGDAGDPFPGQLARKSITADTNPGTRDSNGTDTGVSITDISASAQTMTANLYVVPPMILSFRPSANFVTESVTPTFWATFSNAIDPNSITVTVDDRVVVSQANLSSYYNTVSRELTYRSAQLSFGQHTIAVSVRNQAKTVTESTGNRPFRVNFRTIPSGLRMVSVPYVLATGSNTPDAVFGSTVGQVARWLPTKGEYRKWPQNAEAGFSPPAEDPANPTFAFSKPPVGLGYWIKLSTDTPVRVNGDQIEDTEVRIPLFTGWNMIGDPFPYSVDWNGCQVEYRGQTLSLADAVEAEWISPTLYTYAPGGYTWVTAPVGQLKPWEGYWVKAKVTCWLRVPPVPAGITGFGTSRAPAPRANEGGWQIRLSVSVDGVPTDVHNFIGVAPGASDGADSRDVEEPPAADDMAALRLVQGGRQLARDLRSDAAGAKGWDIEVVTPPGQRNLSLSWPDLRGLPRNLEAFLEDEATGRKVSMRTQAAYAFNSGDGGVRRFRVTVGSRRQATLAITELSISRTRGVPSIHVGISQDAALTVLALSPSGKVERILASERPGRAGVNVVSTGRSDGLAPGIHLLEVRATADDGTTVRAVRPFVVLRD